MNSTDSRGVDKREIVNCRIALARPYIVRSAQLVGPVLPLIRLAESSNTCRRPSTIIRRQLRPTIVRSKLSTMPLPRKHKVTKSTSVRAVASTQCATTWSRTRCVMRKKKVNLLGIQPEPQDKLQTISEEARTEYALTAQSLAQNQTCIWRVNNNSHIDFIVNHISFF